MASLLTVSNPKTAKGEGRGFYTAVLHLAPARQSGADVCAFSTRECQALCLNWAGRGRFESVQAARVRRAVELRKSPREFVRQLRHELANHVVRARRHGLAPAVRLNGTSDIPWERVLGGELLRFCDEHGVQAYDYTKYGHELADPSRGRLLNFRGYHLTYSYTGRRGSWSRARSWLRIGAPVAVVFRHPDDTNELAKPRGWELPETFRGVPVEDGDEHDLTFLRGPVVLGLRAKGRAKRPSPFAVDVTTLEEGAS